MTRVTPLPYGRQLIEDDDVEAVVAVLRSDFLAHGPRVAAFEQAFAEAVGAREAVACSSGTAALHLALAGLDVGPGDLCVVPAITFLSTATAALMCGAEVAFADVDPVTGLMTPDTLAAALAGRRAKAVLPVHLGGRLCDMSGLALIARAAGAAVVEDACHAVGGADRFGAPVGACHASDAACFSFHPVKTLAAGEGGMVTINDPERAARLRRLRNHGVTHDPAMMTEPGSLDAEGARNPWSYEQVELGWNYRLDEMSAALGLSQLGKLTRFTARRAELAALYDAALEPLAPVVRAMRGEGQPGLHLYQVLIDFETADISRAEVMRRMAAAGVATQVHYIPLYRQPFLKTRCGETRLSGAEAFYASALALPLFPAMADGDVARVVEALRQALNRTL
jgi:UDP-4-amino-4,6-dideoxy-N-acetyl-beta-L-altrosamine transaminase